VKRRKAIPIEAQADEPTDSALARAVLDPTFNAATNVPHLVSVEGHELDVGHLMGELRAQCRAVAGGDLSRAEVMLVAQAHMLDVLFAALTRRAAANMSTYLETAERYLRLALKAQSQARATVETLALLKNPQPTVIAKQANVASGPQQVNQSFGNGTRAGARARAGNSDLAPTEESGGQHELLQNARAPAAAFGANPTLAAVGEVHRTEDAGGQGAIVEEPLARRATGAVPSPDARTEHRTRRADRGSR
jgi:hypothetical protein